MKRILPLLLVVILPFLASSQGSRKMLEFNGSSNQVQCGTINLNGTALTLQGWVKVDAFKTGHPYITSLWGIEEGGAQAMVRFGDGNLAANRLQFVIYNGSTHHKLNGQKSLSAGVWYHIAATYDGSTMRTYINGVQDVSMNISTSIVSTNTFRIGQHYGATRTIDGVIDEVSVFKGVLSQNTIRDWMCKSITSSHPNYSALEGYWKLDNGTGATATDHSGKGHHGSLVGNPVWKNSEAPIGDVSIHNFSSPSSMSLSHANGDTFMISGISGSPQSAHMYLVNQAPNNTSPPTGVTELDTTRYYGYWFAEGSNPRASISYRYSSNSHYQNNGTCMIDLGRRLNNAASSWTSMNASQSSNYLTKTSQGAGEYVLMYRSNKVIHQDTSGAVCQGDSVRLRHATSGLTYNWYRNGNVLNNATANTYYAKQDGLYQLVVGLSNCADTSYTYRLRVDTIPMVSMGAIDPSCPDEFIDTISGGMPAGGAYQNNWMSGNLFITQNAGPGAHKIVYRFTDAHGCSDTASSIKLVHPYTNANVARINNVCEDSSAFTLTNGSPAGGAYFVNGNQTSTFDPSALGVGLQQIKYEVTDTNGCSGVDSVTVMVFPLPVINFSIDPDIYCESDTAFELIGASPSGGSYSGTGVNLGWFHPSVAQGGNHMVTYHFTQSSSGCSNTAVDTVFVNPTPNPPVITKMGDTLGSSQGGTYQWYFEGAPIAGATNNLYVPDSNGFYQVSIANFGCESDTSAWFYFEKEVEQPGSVGDYLKAEWVKIYPNPAMDVFNVSISKGIENGVITLISTDGQLVMSKEIETGMSSFDVSELSKGIYLLRMSTRGSELSTRLVVH